MSETQGTTASDSMTSANEPVSRLALPVDGQQGDTRAVDMEIERAIASGEFRRALSLCVQEHGPAIGRLCMAMVGAQAEADDLTQETLLSAHQGFAAWRRESTLRAWVFGIARKKCLQYLERNRRRAGRLRLVGEEERAGTEELILLRQRAERTRVALDAIRPTEREALLLRYVAQLSFRDVAVVCGIDEAAARKRVSRAILKLREQIDTE